MRCEVLSRLSGGIKRIKRENNRHAGQYAVYCMLGIVKPDQTVQRPSDE